TLTKDGLTAPTGKLTGNSGTFSSGTVLPSVTITNRSNNNLVLGDIDLANALAVPDVTLTAEEVSLEFDVASLAPAGEMKILVANEGSGDVLVDGLVNNPVGSITIENTQGSILAGSDATDILRGQSVNLLAGTDLGSPTQRLNVDLVRSLQRQTDLAATAHGGDAHLNIRGRVRDANAGLNDFAAGEITATGNVDLLFQPTLQETTPSGDSGGVSVITNGGPATTINEHYSTDTTNGSQPLDYRLFTDTSKTSAIAGGFTFGTITGTAIDLAASQPESTAPRIDITATTNHADTHDLDALFSGSITLTESAGDFRIGTVQSNAGAVSLTSVAGSIIDVATEPGHAGPTPWIIGNAVSLVAMEGAIGTLSDLLEIDSSRQADLTPQQAADGPVILKARAGVFVQETKGDMAIDAVLSQTEDVLLTTLAGGIVEAETSESAGRADIQARNIDLITVGGGAGTLLNPIEIYGAGRGHRQDTSISIDNAVPGVGRLVVDAQGDVNLTAVGSVADPTNALLRPLSVTATGSVTLTVHDSALAGENLELVPAGPSGEAAGTTLLGTSIPSGLVSGTEVTVSAGDNISLPAGTLIRGTASVTVKGDAQSNDPDPNAGTTMTVLGEVL
ncbi:MAG: hypothetical protein EBU59_12205, partial [Planctomycetia bacterium]|nr:hypothetical protein [Planctomycetia bacterium]